MVATSFTKALRRVLPKTAPRRPRFSDKLLVTDDPGDAAIALFAYTFVLGGVKRGEPCPEGPAQGGSSAALPANVVDVVCHVALDDPATLAGLEAALAVLRPAPRGGEVALTVVPRSGEVHAVLDRLGATRVLAAHRDGSPWTERLDAPCTTFSPRPHASAMPDGGDPLEAEAAAAAAVLAELFAAAGRRGPIAMTAVDRGASAVLRGVRDDIRDWIEVVRRYDDSTYQHCLLVAGFCAALARRIGFSGARQRLVVQAALLHDIGKARVPLALLNKPGALTSAETTVVRRHPTDGYYMLAGQGDIPGLIRDVVLHHHELLDGSGYPHGLRGEQIPEEVRLSTVCDVYAALVEQRSYRQPMASQAAFKVLLDMGGKLDAMLVKALGEILDAPVAVEPAPAP